MNDMLRIARERYTTKHYSGRAIPREELAELLEVLRLSPSSVNSQPWVWFVASTSEEKAKLFPALHDFNRERVGLASDLIVFTIRESYGEAQFKAVLEQEIADGRYAGLEIGPGIDASRRHFVGLNSKTPEELHAWEKAQAYIAMGFLLFAAAGMGIDSTAIEGLDCEKMDEILGLKDKGLRTVAAVSLGYRAEDDSNAMRPKSRLAPEKVFAEV